MSEKRDIQEEQKKSKPKQRRTAQEVMAQTMATWVLTFADLMSLLMAFFVMLFALSEVDKEKFKMMGISMQQAFGSPVSTTVDPSTNESIDKQDSGKDKNYDIIPPYSKDSIGNGEGGAIPITVDLEQTNKDASTLRELLKDQIVKNQVEVTNKGHVIIVRLLDKAAFESGSAEINEDFKPVLHKLGDALHNMEGEIIISGFTDDVPISNIRYRSNWELSSSRSYSVVDEFLKKSGLPADRMQIRGFADTHNLVPNDNPENRARNRRVEIMLNQVPKFKVAKQTQQKQKEPAKEKPLSMLDKENLNNAPDHSQVNLMPELLIQPSVQKNDASALIPLSNNNGNETEEVVQKPNDPTYDVAPATIGSEDEIMPIPLEYDS